MEKTTTETAALPLLGGDWSDPLEDGVRSRVLGLIEAILEEEFEAALGRKRYELGESANCRHGIAAGGSSAHSARRRSRFHAPG